MKTKRITSIAALALALVLSIVGTSCSAVDPDVLSVGTWSLSESTFQSQIDQFAKVYEAQGGASSLRSADGNSWSTSFTAAFLNDQLNLQLARLAAEKRGIEITDAARANAKTVLEKNYSNGSTSTFDKLPLDYQNGLIEGVAAETLLADVVIAEAQTDEALRKLYDSTKEQYAVEMVCASHILISAGSGSANATPTDAQYATALASIKEIQSQIGSPSQFAAIAKAKSQDTGSAADGGALGCTTKDSYVAGFEEAVWSQPIGVVSQPVKTKYGYHLILVSDRGVLTFEQLKSTLAAAVASNASKILAAELTRIAAELDISVDGRYGSFDPQTFQISAPLTAAVPSTTTSMPAGISQMPQMLSGATQ